MPPRKPVKKQTSSLFDEIDDEPAQPEPVTTPAEKSTSFVKLVGERPTEAATFVERVRPEIASGEKSKARDIIAAVKTLHLIEKEHRPAEPEEREVLARFCGFGPVALSIFPYAASPHIEVVAQHDANDPVASAWVRHAEEKAPELWAKLNERRRGRG